MYPREIRVNNPTEALIVEQALAMVREMQQTATAAPDGQVLGQVEKAGVTLEKLLVTHGHLDHCGATGELAERLLGQNQRMIAAGTLASVELAASQAELERRRVHWFTETDISVGQDDELLELMRRSGCAQCEILGFQLEFCTGARFEQ